MNLIPFTPQRFTDSALFLKDVDGQKLLIKTFINGDAESRLVLEQKKNLHWSASGFRVPKLLDTRIPEISGPYLAMEFIEGVNLSDYLKDQQAPLQAKLKILGEIFATNHQRHLQALANEDELLIHTDPNTDNIILSDGSIVFIDFEHISKVGSIPFAVAKEVATFVRRVIRNIGATHTDQVVEIMLNAYNYDDVMMNKLEELALGRSFQNLRRLKARLRKRKDPELVTRYDVADAVSRMRKNH
jgi:tRNA A-37 threonylcarbamoyl transferase component Bud32